MLDEDHFGLDKIKRRILEYLAVRKLNPEGKSPILCFVGPPGVGKTSLGQSIARATGRELPARRAGRRARRGGDPRPSAHLHRCAAGQHHPGDERAGSRTGVLMLDEIDKLGAGGFHGDPSCGAARGARSGAELEVPRQLPRRRLRPVEGDVHRHREPARHHSRAAARPHGDHPASRLHRGGKARDRAALSGEAPARSERPDGRAGRRDRRGAARRDRRLHARGRRAQPRTRDRLRAARASRCRIAEGAGAERSRSTRRTCTRSSAPRASRTKSRCAPACPAWRPGSRGRRWAATSCSSRRPRCRARAS